MPNDDPPPGFVSRLPSAADRKVAFNRGISAESLAAAWMIGKGYRVLARRFRCAAGEIDLIMARRHTIAFIEVKARATLDGAAESVTERQRRRIIGAAEIWLAKNPSVKFQDLRFDAILIAPGKIPRHIPGAFDAN